MSLNHTKNMQGRQSLPAASAGGEDPDKISCTAEFLRSLREFDWILDLRPRMKSSHDFAIDLHKQYLVQRSPIRINLYFIPK